MSVLYYTGKNTSVIIIKDSLPGIDCNGSMYATVVGRGYLCLPGEAAPSSMCSFSNSRRIRRRISAVRAHWSDG